MKSELTCCNSRKRAISALANRTAPRSYTRLTKRSTILVMAELNFIRSGIIERLRNRFVESVLECALKDACGKLGLILGGGERSSVLKGCVDLGVASLSL